MQPPGKEPGDIRIGVETGEVFVQHIDLGFNLRIGNILSDGAINNVHDARNRHNRVGRRRSIVSQVGNRALQCLLVHFELARISRISGHLGIHIVRCVAADGVRISGLSV